MSAGPLLIACCLVLSACSVAGGSADDPGEPDPIDQSVTTVPATGSQDPVELSAPDPTAPPVGRCADVIAVDADRQVEGTYSFSVTVSSDERGWDKYADAWEVRSVGGSVLGVRVLAHPHETEQPFTRSLGGVEVPEGTEEVVVVARDSVLGFCGAAYTVSLVG